MNPDLAAALAAFAEGVPANHIDEVWIFPARSAGDRESGLAVVAASAGEADPDRRVIWTVQYEVTGGRHPARIRGDEVTEQGTVPANRLERLISEVVRRSGGEEVLPPSRSIRGSEARWVELIEELRGHVDGIVQE